MARHDSSARCYLPNPQGHAPEIDPRHARAETNEHVARMATLWRNQRSRDTVLPEFRCAVLDLLLCELANGCIQTSEVH